MNELAKWQLDAETKLLQLHSNLRKTPCERRTEEFFNQKTREAEEIQNQVENNQKLINELASENSTHEYFTTNRYKQISKNILQFFDTLNKMSEAQKGQKNVIPKEINGLDELIFSLSKDINDALNKDLKPEQYKLRAKLYESRLAAIQEQHIIQTGVLRDFNQNESQLSKSMDELIDGIAMLYEKAKENVKETPLSHDIATPNNACNKLILPKLMIPKFDGSYLKWQSFHDMFYNMVHTQQLPQIEKFIHLKGHVSGEAERIINHYQLTEANYTAAWSALIDRYDNKRVICSTLLDQIMHLPNATDHSTIKHIKQLHDVTSEVLAGLQNLNIDISSTPFFCTLLSKNLIKPLICYMNKHLKIQRSSRLCQAS